MAEQEPDRAERVREAVGVFGDARDLEQAVQDLLTSGFNQEDVSVLAREETVSAQLGHRLRDIREVEDDPEAPRRAWAGPESRTQGRGALAGVMGYVGAVTAGGLAFAVGGPVSAVVAAGLVAGGAMGAAGVALGNLLDRRFADSLRNQLEHGGILLWVHVRDPEQERAAVEVLNRHAARDVHVHELRAG